MNEYELEHERLVAWCALLWKVQALLRLKNRHHAADTLHSEWLHFAAERDITAAMNELDNDIHAGQPTIRREN